MLGRPAALRAGPVVVGPDDLVLEAVASEDRVQGHLGVVDLAAVQVHEEAAGGLEHPPGLLQARDQEAQVVLEAILVGAPTQHGGPVSPALEADPVAIRILLGAQAGSGLGSTGIEGRVQVDQVIAGVGEAGDHLEVVPQVDLQGPGPVRRVRNREVPHPGGCRSVPRRGAHSGALAPGPTISSQANQKGCRVLYQRSTSSRRTC